MKKPIRLPQEMDTDIQSVSDSIWQYQYAYYRSMESREVNDLGQDYVTYLADEDCMSFVICDGVSLSYFGDLAARILGDQLLSWLYSQEQIEIDTRSIQSDLETYLVEITNAATRQLDTHKIPDYIQGILREVLLDKKEHGSDSIYGAARIDLPCSVYPKGRILIVWQGDIRIRLWSHNEERTEELGNQLASSHRWNSKVGPVGSLPHVYCSDLISFGTKGRLILYSDGLKDLDCLINPDIDEIKSALNISIQDPSSDDMSFFNIDWDIAAIKK